MHRYLFGFLLALAGMHGAVHADSDHDRARSALMAGEVLPLKQILETLERQQPGQALELELDKDRGTWLYEIQWLQPDGRLLKLEVDARTGQILRQKLHDRRDR